MTTDQSHYQSLQSTACNLGAISSAEGSDAPLAPNRVRRAQSLTERLFSMSQEDIARLTEVVHGFACTAAMRGVDGVLVPLNAGADDRIGPPAGADKARNARLHSAPIYDAEGNQLASLEVTQRGLHRADSSEKLLGALMESAACSMSERWFRAAHRRHWVVAAKRRNSPNTSMLLAADRNQKLTGADGGARAVLAARGRRFDSGLELSSLFQTAPGLFGRRAYSDAAITLRAAGDGDPWIALITPPDMSATQPLDDPRVQLHTRARLHTLSSLHAVSPEQRSHRGLSRGAIRRIEEHIEANLDSALDIQELAAVVRLSSSHFTRSFHKSVGLTPHRYVIQHRVMKARELLTSTDLPLTEIALTTGFSDQSHFSRRFHELVGVPPGAFRGHRDFVRQ